MSAVLIEMDQFRDQLVVECKKHFCPGDRNTEEQWRKEVFGKVRILTAGRSGAGKTTLLRMMIGEVEGPESISHGSPGVQDINKEFHYKAEHNIPLVFHDTNGMDTRGGENKAIIREFLEKRETSLDYSEHVHLVWYVVNAIDNRFLDDNDLMHLISDFHNIPMLLVLTHTDKEDQVVKDEDLHDMIDVKMKKHKDQAEWMKQNIIKVGNKVKKNRKDNSIIVMHQDVEGLQNLAKMTGKLLESGPQRKATWAAFQAVDIEMKLQSSAEMIAEYARRALLSWPLGGMIPFTDFVKIIILFNQIFSNLCATWAVPKIVSQILTENLLQNERTSSVLRSIEKDLLKVGSSAVAIGATVMSGGSTAVVLGPAIASAVAAMLANANSSAVMVKGFALQVLANILFVMCRQPLAISHGCRWNPNLSESDCQNLCDEFFKNADYNAELKQFALTSHSTTDTFMGRNEIVEDILKTKMLRVFQDMCLRGNPN